ncbi:hypothetical protein AOLI_G00141070 [Acnodon oligacanthus]
MPYLSSPASRTTIQQPEGLLLAGAGTVKGSSLRAVAGAVVVGQRGAVPSGKTADVTQAARVSQELPSPNHLPDSNSQIPSRATVAYIATISQSQKSSPPHLIHLFRQLFKLRRSVEKPAERYSYSYSSSVYMPGNWLRVREASRDMGRRQWDTVDTPNPPQHSNDLWLREREPGPQRGFRAAFAWLRRACSILNTSSALALKTGKSSDHIPPNLLWHTPQKPGFYRHGSKAPASPPEKGTTNKRRR